FCYLRLVSLTDRGLLGSYGDAAARTEGVQRIFGRDGTAEGAGGIEAWLQLGEAVGLHREELLDQRDVLPRVRFAVDAYVHFARRAGWKEAASSSLTELFAPQIHQSRLDSWP